jgi:hypothetical protein
MRRTIYKLLSRVKRAPVLTFALFFEPRDLWVGIYIDTWGRRIYICPVPMFGLRIVWRWEDV